ncbi:MAG: DUF393 domain-containing protein [Thermoguttaceae bacterium]|jgi:predicted DCC family thiol-disulfide oxidoreductase YuxK
MAGKVLPEAAGVGAVADASSLPSPGARPQAAVVVYDAHCRVCSDMMNRLNRWDTADRLAYLSLHDPEVADRYPDLKHDDLMREIYLVDSDGNRHRGVAALREICRRVPRLRPFLPLFHLPGGARMMGWFYMLFARARYRFGRSGACGDGSCQVHFGSTKR